MGFILGTVTIFNYGAGSAGIMRTLGKYMAGSAATFRCARQRDEFRESTLTDVFQCFHGRRQCHPHRHIACDVRNMGEISVSASSSSKTIPTSPTKRKVIPKMRNVYHSLACLFVTFGQDIFSISVSVITYLPALAISTFQSSPNGTVLKLLAWHYGNCGCFCSAKSLTSLLGTGS
jgi:hypothetical protein